MPDEELLEVRPRTAPRSVLGAALFVIVALAIWGGIRLARQGGSPTPVAAPSPTAAPSTPVSTTGPDGPFDPVTTIREQNLAYVFSSAHDTTPAHDMVRSGSGTESCALVPPGTSPQDRLRTLVRQALPGYTVTDESRIIDQFTGLCVLNLRAHDAPGTALVVRVVAPIEDAPILTPKVADGDAVSGGTATQYVQVTTRDGWIVTVGTSGPPAAQPSRTVLMTLAEEPSARW